jgi:phosphoribosylformylglycinamidine synthase II
MTEPAITPELVAKHNLTPEEYAHAREILGGREPSYTELGIFSVMWSEHCSYKNTKPLLRTFPTKSPKILVGAGEENAGIIDIGDNLAIAFKIESHNHPSAVEPFQGAATGVGGIVRDIFTMGARPIAALNSLRFGPITADGSESGKVGGGESGRGASSAEVPPAHSPTCPPATTSAQAANNRHLFAGVVSGIAHYGNCFGIPTIAGEVYFDKSYEGNPLVNAFCLGVLRHDQIARGAAKGIGNPVFYVGPATGRDGLAGAAFASKDLTEESAEQQRGAVQVGDPFMEKLVCEACLELLATGCVAGIQDMGAAGLTCSTCEMAARAGTGIEIELDKVPQRVPNMSSYDLMLSESQERMLIVVKKGHEAEVKRIFDKWDLPWAEVGFVTDTGRMVVRHGGKLIVDIPAKKIADESPVYQRASQEPEYLKAIRAFRLDGIADTKSPMDDLKKLLAWPSIASKNWVYRQYDYMVRDNSIICPGSDAAVLRIKADCVPQCETNPSTAKVPDKFIAMSVDCNGVYVYLDPYEGGKAAVTEACRNLACSGAVPLGATDNLNMANPHKPELFWQMQESVRGLADGCRAFNAPVTGGNCSLYNQNPSGPIDPTPTVAVVGIIEEPEHITTQWFKDEGDAIILLGTPVDTADPILGLGGSAYLQVIHGQKTGSPPRCDLDVAKTLHTSLLGLIHTGDIKSAHDCSDGGLAVALAESCISELIAKDTPRLLGATIDLSQLAPSGMSDAQLLKEFKGMVSPVKVQEALDASGEVDQAALEKLKAKHACRLDALLFGETQSRVVISTKAINATKVIERAKLLGVPAVKIGTVGGDKLTIKTGAGEFSAALTELHDGWWNSIARAMA